MQDTITFKSKSGNKEWFNICFFNTLDKDIVNRSLLSQIIEYKVDDGEWKTFTSYYNNNVYRKVVYGYQVTLKNYQTEADENNQGALYVTYETSYSTINEETKYVSYGNPFLKGIKIQIDEIDDMTAQELLSEIEELKNKVINLQEKLNLSESWYGGEALNNYINNKGYITYNTIEDYATKEFVNDQINDTKVDLSSYATISYVTSSINSIPQVDFTAYATKSYVNATIINMLDTNLIDYAKKSYVIDNITISKPDLTYYATKTYVSTAISNIPEVDLSNYATKSYVNTAIDEIPEIDLSDYATKSYVNTAIDEIPEIDLSDYATKSYVNTAISNIDLSAYATTTYVQNLINNLDLSNYVDSSSLIDIISRLDNLESDVSGLENAGNIIDFLLPNGAASTELPEPVFNYVTGSVDEYTSNYELSFSIKSNCRFYIDIVLNTNNHNNITFNYVTINGSEMKTSNNIGEHLFNSTDGLTKTLLVNLTVSNYNDISSQDLYDEVTAQISIIPEGNIAGTQITQHTFKCWNNNSFIDTTFNPDAYFYFGDDSTASAYVLNVDSGDTTASISFNTDYETITAVIGDVEYNYNEGKSSLYKNWLTAININGGTVSLTFQDTSGYSSVNVRRNAVIKFKNENNKVVGQLTLSQKVYYISFNESTSAGYLRGDEASFQVAWRTNVPDEKFSITITDSNSNSYSLVNKTQQANGEYIATINCGANNTGAIVTYYINVMAPRRGVMNNEITLYTSKTIEHEINEEKYIYFGLVSQTNEQIIANHITSINFGTFGWEAWSSIYESTPSLPANMQLKCITNYRSAVFDDLVEYTTDGFLYLGLTWNQNSSNLYVSVSENLTADTLTSTAIIKSKQLIDNTTFARTNTSNTSPVIYFTATAQQEGCPPLTSTMDYTGTYMVSPGYAYGTRILYVETNGQTESTLNVPSTGGTFDINLITTFRRATLHSDRGLVPIKITPSNSWITNVDLDKEYKYINPSSTITITVDENTSGEARSCDIEIRTLTNTAGGIDYSENNQTVRITVHVNQSA